MSITDPIRKSVQVPLSPADAFTLFTEKMDTWWPLASHGVGAQDGQKPSTEVRVDQHAGGKVVEIMENKEEALWGEILEWAPGERFRMTWCPGRSPEHPTEVEVTFLPVGNGTRVELVHSGFDTHASWTAAHANYDQGWGVLLGKLFKGAAQRLVPA